MAVRVLATRKVRCVQCKKSGADRDVVARTVATDVAGTIPIEIVACPACDGIPR